MKPTTRTLIWICCTLVLATLGVFDSRFLVVWQGVVYVLAAVLIWDLLRLRQNRKFAISRHVNSNLPIGAWSDVSITIQNQNGIRIQLELFDYIPDNFDTRGLPVGLRLESNQPVTVTYKVKPGNRGDAVFSGLDLMTTSPFRLWKMRNFFPVASSVKVYPNFAEIARYTLLATDNHLSQFGIRRYQRLGQGMDFHQLREYRIGDTVSQIDWNATARRQKFVSRQYHDERDQQIVFLVDCGRRMRHMEDGQAHMDQALNAMLLLGYVAARQGDAVGFLAFAGPHKWVAPRKGTQTVNYLLSQCYDLTSTLEPADYLLAAQKLFGVQRRRALIVILSNSRAEDQHDLTQAIKLLTRRHVVVFADLQEPGLREALDAKVTHIDSALTFHSVYDYLNRRKKIHEALSHLGAMCLDTTARELPVRLVNQYLDIKRTARL